MKIDKKYMEFIQSIKTKLCKAAMQRKPRATPTVF